MFNKDALIRDFNQLMVEHYSNRLARIILYGSYARGDFHEEIKISWIIQRCCQSLLLRIFLDC
jgi:predicted nucleotidyltransferase